MARRCTVPTLSRARWPSGSISRDQRAGRLGAGYAAARVIRDIQPGTCAGSGAAWLLAVLVVIGELRPVLTRHATTADHPVAFSLALLDLSAGTPRWWPRPAR